MNRRDDEQRRLPPGNQEQRGPYDQQYGRWRAQQRDYNSNPFSRQEQPHYFGTGSQGAGGGPTFTGGTFGHAQEQADSPRFDEIGFNHDYSGEFDVPTTDHHPADHYPRAFGVRRGAVQPRRRYPLGPKGYQRSDERLREDISERLMQSYHIDSSEVTVEVRGGKVVLEGTVPDRHMKHAIEDLADAAPGVQDIENHIRVAGVGPGTHLSGEGHGAAWPASGISTTGGDSSALTPGGGPNNGSPSSSKARKD